MDQIKAVLSTLTVADAIKLAAENENFDLWEFVEATANLPPLNDIQSKIWLIKKD